MARILYRLRARRARLSNPEPTVEAARVTAAAGLRATIITAVVTLVGSVSMLGVAVYNAEQQEDRHSATLSCDSAFKRAYGSVFDSPDYADVLFEADNGEALFTAEERDACPTWPEFLAELRARVQVDGAVPAQRSSPRTP